jgi:hypothetical protein
MLSMSQPCWMLAQFRRPTEMLNTPLHDCRDIKIT